MCQIESDIAGMCPNYNVLPGIAVNGSTNSNEVESRLASIGCS